MKERVDFLREQRERASGRPGVERHMQEAENVGPRGENTAEFFHHLGARVHEWFKGLFIDFVHNCAVRAQ